MPKPVTINIFQPQKFDDNHNTVLHSRSPWNSWISAMYDSAASSVYINRLLFNIYKRFCSLFVMISPTVLIFLYECYACCRMYLVDTEHSWVSLGPAIGRRKAR